MPDSDRISIDNLTLAPDLSNNDVAPVVHTVNGVKSTYKATMTLLGTFLNKVLQYSADLTTSNKTIIGAINEINTGGGGGGAVILYGTTAPASSLGSDGNLYVQYTEGTGGASDVVDALYVKLDDEWCEISTGGGSGSSGHVIVDEDGTSLTQRANLQFNGAYLEDNSVDDTTEVNVVREMTRAQFNQLTADEKTGLINITDESLNATEIPITDGSQTNTKSYIDSGLSGKVDTTDFDATNLPITSGSATNTKDYIDSKTSSASYSINNLDFYRSGNVVFCNIIAGTNSTDASGLIVSGGSNVVIKSGYRPPNNVNVVDTVTMARMTCNFDGTIWTNKVSQTGLSIRISACWITNDAFPT